MNTNEVKTIESQRQKHKEKKLLFIVQLLLGMILLVTASYVLYINRYHPAINNLLGGNLNSIRSKNPSSVTLDSSIEYNFNVYKDNILLTSRDGIKAINKAGEEIWSITMTLSDPLVESNHKYILVADKGGREVNVVTNYSIVCTRKTEEPIVAVAINETGYFAIVTKEKGYKGKVSVFNPEGQEIYKWHSVDNYIADLDISNDGKKLAVSTIDLSKGYVSSGVAFFNLTEEKPYAGIVIDETLISNIKFYQDGSVVVVGDNQMIGFSPQGIQKWNISYAEKDLQIFSMDSDKIIALGLREKKGGSLLNGNSLVEIYTFGGVKKGTYEVDGDIQFVDVEDDLVALNKKRDVYVVTSQGNEIAKAVSSKDIRDIILFQNKRDIVVVSRNTLEVLELKRN